MEYVTEVLIIIANIFVHIIKQWHHIIRSVKSAWKVVKTYSNVNGVQKEMIYIVIIDVPFTETGLPVSHARITVVNIFGSVEGVKMDMGLMHIAFTTVHCG